LALAWACKSWQTLPEAGGYYDQPWATMQNMNAAQNVYNSVIAVRRAKGEQIHRLPPEVLNTVAWLGEQGLINLRIPSRWPKPT